MKVLIFLSVLMTAGLANAEILAVSGIGHVSANGCKKLVASVQKSFQDETDIKKAQSQFPNRKFLGFARGQCQQQTVGHGSIQVKYWEVPTFALYE